MSWTYSGDPGTSALDAVRFWMQDIQEQRQLLQNEDINYLLNTWMPSVQSVIFVAAVGCEVVAARYADEVQVSADGVSVSVGDLQQKYMTLAEQLRDQWDEVVVPGSWPTYCLDPNGDWVLCSSLGSGGDGGNGGILDGSGGNNSSLWGQGHDYQITATRFGIGHMDNFEAGRQDYGGYDPGNQGAGYMNAVPDDAILVNVAARGIAAQRFKGKVGK